jgi:hypothetical protein
MLQGAMVVNPSAVLYILTHTFSTKRLVHHRSLRSFMLSLPQRDCGNGERFSSRQRGVSVGGGGVGVGGGAESTDMTNELLALRVQQLEEELRELRRHVMYATAEQGRCARRGCGAKPRTACRGCQRWLCVECFEAHHANND